jgi:exodeoxyribonuclease V alpha subunit
VRMKATSHLDSGGLVHQEWMRRRWDLPAGLEKYLPSLLQAMAGGSTAVSVGAIGSKVEESFGNWKEASVDRDGPLVRVDWEGEIFLQSRRFFAAERGVVKGLKRMIDGAVDGPTSDDFWAELFPGQKAESPQVQAARMAWRQSLTLLTGGPGTGKTHTLARLLLGLARIGLVGKEMALLAPTGKAAERMRQAVEEALSSLPCGWEREVGEVRLAAAQSGTVHRWLRQRDRGRAAVPRVVLIDECSMLDLVLWETVLRGMVAGQRLILVGDPEQLESVGQGNVLTELVAEAQRAGSVLENCWVELRESHRFRDRPKIGQLVEAVRQGESEAVGQLLASADEATDGVEWVKLETGLPRVGDWPEPLRRGWIELARSKTPEEALHALRRQCVLTAHRVGAFGASGINGSIAAWLARQGEAGYHPIIVQRNDAETGLRNGSLGAALGEEVWFPQGEGAKKFLLGQLPDYLDAWAMTIHRAQGSEYDQVGVVLPPADSPLLGKELLYTALTRAKKRLTIFATEDALKMAVATRSKRISLLASAWRELGGQNLP